MFDKCKYVLFYYLFKDWKMTYETNRNNTHSFLHNIFKNYAKSSIHVLMKENTNMYMRY